MALAQLLEKGSDTELLREMIGYVAHRLMDAEVEGLVGAGHGERSQTRESWRNGCRERDWHTPGATIPLRIPKLRKGTYLLGFLEPRRSSEKALGMSGISKSQVSRVGEEMDERVDGFLTRALEGDWPYLWIDAIYVKVREAGRIVSVATTIAVAVNREGRREVLGMATGPSEAEEPFWTAFLRSLLRRGLRGLKLVISDAHEGLKAASGKVLEASWQRCRVHFLRNALAHANRGQRQMVFALINTIFAQESADQTHRQWRVVSDQLRERFARLAAMMDEAGNEVLAFMDVPKERRVKIRGFTE